MQVNFLTENLTTSSKGSETRIECKLNEYSYSYSKRIFDCIWYLRFSPVVSSSFRIYQNLSRPERRLSIVSSHPETTLRLWKMMRRIYRPTWRSVRTVSSNLSLSWSRILLWDSLLLLTGPMLKSLSEWQARKSELMDSRPLRAGWGRLRLDTHLRKETLRGSCFSE